MGRDSIYDRFENLQNLVNDNKNQIRRMEKLKPLIDLKLARLEIVLQMRKNEGYSAVANDETMEEGKMIMDDIRTILAAMSTEENNLLKDQNTTMDSVNQETNQTVIWGILFSVIILSIIGFLITQNIAKPLKQVTNKAELIADGDLSLEFITTDRNDELGLLMQSFNKMIKMLRQQNQEILKGVNVIATTTAEILASTAQITAGAAQTAVAITETTTTVEQVRNATKLSSQKAKVLSESANLVAKASIEGQKAVNETIEGINFINTQMDVIAQTVILLSEQSQSIGGIIASVTDLADQSNLLAVKAAIEAAKAGEQGKGFTVVAQEIRNLAEQSKQATMQVRKILNDVQKATSAAVLATEQGNRAVEAGVKKSIQAGESIRILTESSKESVQVSIQISPVFPHQLHKCVNIATMHQICVTVYITMRYIFVLQ